MVGCALVAAGCAPAEPDPPPVVDAAGIPRAGEGSEPRFGYNGDLIPGGAAFATVAGSGADTMRSLLSWQAIEPSPGRRDWSVPDALYRQLVARGTRPLWVVVGAPCWASALGEACEPNLPGKAVGVDHAGELADFLSEAAERYPESLGFEIGNEQNLAVYWRGGLHPDDYATLLGASADAIHAVDPELPVIAGGLAPVTRPRPGAVPWRSYLRAIYSSGVDERIDGVGFHPYAALEPGQEYPPAVAGLVEQVRRMLRELGDPGMPIWITEVGLSTEGPAAVSPAEQARGLVEIYRRLQRLGVAAIVIHRLVDQIFPQYASDAGYGVIEADSVTPKPAYCALARVRAEPCG